MSTRFRKQVVSFAFLLFSFASANTQAGFPALSGFVDGSFPGHVATAQEALVIACTWHGWGPISYELVQQNQYSAMYGGRCQAPPPPDPHITELGFGWEYYCPKGYSIDYQTLTCNRTAIVPTENMGRSGCQAGGNHTMCGNPINVGTANKYQLETDYVGSGPYPLIFQRHYNSQMIEPLGSTGAKWRHTYERNANLYPGNLLEIVRPDANIEYYILVGGVWTPDGQSVAKITQLFDASNNPNGWKYVSEQNETEIYDVTGKLISITRLGGLKHTLTYDTNGRLITVTDDFGRTLGFTYGTMGRLETLTDPNGKIYTYTYQNNYELISITYPDNTPGDPNDNPKRTYHYNEWQYTQSANLPYYLTGITDENGDRFAIFQYESGGRALSTEHAGGVEKITVNYNSDWFTNTITDALGGTKTFAFTQIFGIKKNTSITRPSCPTCGTASTTYDANGFIQSKTDFNG